MKPKEQQLLQTEHQVLRTTLKFPSECWGRFYVSSKITKKGYAEETGGINLCGTPLLPSHLNLNSQNHSLPPSKHTFASFLMGCPSHCLEKPEEESCFPLLSANCSISSGRTGTSAGGYHLASFAQPPGLHHCRTEVSETETSKL